MTISAVREPFVNAEHTVLGCRCVLVAVRQARALKGERAWTYILNNICEYLSVCYICVRPMLNHDVNDS